MRRKGAGKVERREVEGEDMATGIACDARPGTGGDGGVPGGERRTRVIGDGVFEGEKGL